MPETLRPCGGPNLWCELPASRPPSAVLPVNYTANYWSEASAENANVTSSTFMKLTISNVPQRSALLWCALHAVHAAPVKGRAPLPAVPSPAVQFSLACCSLFCWISTAHL